ncbi:MAG TPA: VOC family protein [Rhizomicrobium sp.]|jgi:catechol 2,3-dioxygenase-like lactoylglutathione lyase family enzyme|nr:VOC family protein [Rhizomicrobium sp.]
MLHHVSVGVADVTRAATFYDAVLKTLGYKRLAEYLPYAVAYGEDHPEFWIGLPHDQRPMSVGNGVHLGFSARSKDQVHKFHAAALAQGGSNNGEPGPRPDYGPDYYGAFVYDLDGNKIEATLHARPKAQAAKRPAKKAAKRTVKKAKKKAAKKARKKSRR